MTLDKYPNVTDCVVEVEVFYPATTQLCYGGVAARHPGGAGEAGLVMTKLQDNTTTGNFNTSWMYERPGAAQLVNLVPTSTAAIVRMIVKDRTSWQQIDLDQDGRFDLAGAARPFAAATTLNQGRVGLNGYRVAEMDNFKFFDGVVMADPATQPKINTTYRITFRAPLVGGGPTPFIGLLSGGKAGIPLDPGRAIPLTLDVLLSLSLSMGLNGVLTTANPDGVMSLPLPNDPSLVGIVVYASAFTLDATQPFTIGAIGNDHEFTIQS
jgi:hypothetical protein